MADNISLLVEYKDVKYYLNNNLIKRQNLTLEEIEKLIETHIEKLKVFEKMNLTEDSSELKKLANEVELIEYKLQSIWGFSLNKDRHLWYEVPKCSCPKLDNKDNNNSKYRVYSLDCLVHA